MTSLGDQIVQGLEDLVKTLEAGLPVVVTTVERTETPDGPVHERKTEYRPLTRPKGRA